MRHGRRATVLGAAVLTVMAGAGCSSSSDSGTSTAAQSSASAVAAASTAATAKPGEYGSPVNPSLPNPTDVATDAPVTPKAGASGVGASGVGTSGSGTSVDVVVTYSDWDDTLAGVEVGAYAAGIAESGGTCILTLTKGSDTASAEASAEPDAASTSCPGLVVPGSKLSSGSWKAVVSYESRDSHGQSDPVEVVVP